MSQNTRVFISVTAIVVFFGTLLLLIWLWYAYQLDELNRKQKDATGLSLVIQNSLHTHHTEHTAKFKTYLNSIKL